MHGFKMKLPPKQGRIRDLSKTEELYHVYSTSFLLYQNISMYKLKNIFQCFLIYFDEKIRKGSSMISSVRFEHLSCWVLHHCHCHCQEEAVVHHSTLQSYWSHPTMNNDMHIFGIYFSAASLSISLSIISNKTLIILTFGHLHDTWNILLG